MANPFTIKLNGLNEAISAFKKEGISIGKELSAEIRASAVEIERKASQRAPISDGALRRAISVKKNTPLNYSVVAGVFYAPYLEFGTKTYVDVPPGLEAYAAQFRGKGKGDFQDLVLAIAKWIKKKGIGGTQIVQLKSGKRKGQFRKAGRKAQDRADLNLAWSIAFMIAKKGIKPQLFMWPSFMEEKPNLINNINKVITKKR